MKTHDDDVAALAVAGGSDDESEVPRQKCLALIASLRERAKDLLQVEDQAEIAKRTSRMMLDMLALKRLNQEVFDAIAVRADELEGLKVRGRIGLAARQRLAADFLSVLVCFLFLCLGFSWRVLFVSE